MKKLCVKPKRSCEFISKDWTLRTKLLLMSFWQVSWKKRKNAFFKSRKIRIQEAWLSDSHHTWNHNIQMMYGSECDIQIWWTEVENVARGCSPGATFQCVQIFAISHGRLPTRSAFDNDEVMWQRFDQSAKQLIIGHTTKQNKKRMLVIAVMWYRVLKSKGDFSN